MTVYAHTKEGAGPDEWQELQAHLDNVAKLMASFCEPFQAGQWGHIIGELHDIGKHVPLFQKRLTGEYTKSVDHKGVGARLLESLGSGFGRIGAYCVAGHHGGLPDYSGAKNGCSFKKLVVKAAALPDGVKDPLQGYVEPPLPFRLNHPFQCAFFTRMLFSALVDADFLDTEAFVDAEKSSWRSPGPSLEALVEGLDKKLTTFDKAGRINKLRAKILTHCRAKAALKPGLFTLTVPTGGGKTLTSMAFALDHALLHGKRRIVYVIPYTSIIEQNAQIFRDIFPDNSVIEHHSNFDSQRIFQDDYAEESLQARRHRLACENWDSPVVVTTNVQFFESLFSHKVSQCRKLHNLADSVIILDEAQMLPVNFLAPCLRVLEELAENYGASVVLCTATQPALRREDFSIGLSGLNEERELAPDPDRMHRAFKRTELVALGELALPEVADWVREREQVLCIVNTRSRAFELFERVRDTAGTWHLSALMCPAHRSRQLDAIRRELVSGNPCRVISTQLIEAGVDVSFPEVIREVAGLDSITQAAGRCNRGGEFGNDAVVSIFTPAEGLPPIFRVPAAYTGSVLCGAEGKDPFSPDAIRKYFTLYYWNNVAKMDEKNVMTELNSPKCQWNYRMASAKFKLIDTVMIPVVIPYGDRAKKLISSLEYMAHPGAVLRKLQQYTVQIYSHQFASLDEMGAIEWVAETCAVLCREELYDEQFGLLVSGGCTLEDFLA